MALGTEDFRSLVPTGDSSKKTTVRDATVLRVEGGTAWVAIDGGAAETPARIDMDAKPGDRVRVQITDHTAVVAGNSTAPATDDSLAEEAQYMAAEAISEAVRAASEAERAIAAADEAAAVAQATDQHFFADGSGIHVTENENDASTGHNILINSLGLLLRKAVNNLVSITQSAIAFYDGLGNSASNVVAQFGSGGATIGKTGAARQEMDYRTWKMKDKNQNVYAEVIDNRVTDGYATIVQSYPFWYVTSSNEFDLYLTASTVTGVVFNNGSADTTIPSSGYTLTVDGSRYYVIVQWSYLSTNGTVKITYKTASDAAKSFTFGSRLDGDSAVKGPMSFAEGRNVEASGPVSHAEGYDTHAVGTYAHAEGRSTTATGWASHAEGNQTVASGDRAHAGGYGTVAAANNQTAIGRFNKIDDPTDGIDKAFIVGNGTSDSNRSNALTVDWLGNIDNLDGRTFTNALMVFGYVTGSALIVQLYVPLPGFAETVTVTGTGAFTLRGGTGATLSVSVAATNITTKLVTGFGNLLDLRFTLSTAFAGGNNTSLAGFVSGLTLKFT